MREHDARKNKQNALTQSAGGDAYSGKMTVPVQLGIANVSASCVISAQFASNHDFAVGPSPLTSRPVDIAKDMKPHVSADDVEVPPKRQK